jgi:hypothetical protein
MTSVNSAGGSRATTLGSRRAGGVLVAVIAVAAIVTAPFYLHHGHSAGPRHPSPAATYGGLPTWLPKAAIPVGRVVQASARRPWLAIEGDTVSVQLAHGKTLATAVGPEVPEEGQFPVPATTPCTFLITFAQSSGTVALSAASFTIVDEFGGLHHPAMALQGGGKLPATVAPGKTVTVIARAVLPTGSGTLRWAPATANPIVSWDFEVEID